MGLFDKIKEPMFFKDDSSAQSHLAALQELKKTATGEVAEEIEQEIRRVDAGIYGEKAVRYELENSHIPMFVLHDLYLEHDGLTAQIDYMIITRKHIFILECKNLYGNIEINSAGDFVRTVTFGRHTKKEGIYSPITQNRRHLELIKQIRGAERGNFLTKAIFEKHFYDTYHAVVVLANPKTILNARYAKKEARDQVIKVDQLAEYIRRVDADPKADPSSERDIQELAQFFLNAHKEQSPDYVAKFKDRFKPEKPASAMPVEPILPKAVSEETPVFCPKCGAVMIRRKASKGTNAGNEFYGCSRYPKCRGIVQI